MRIKKISQSAFFVVGAKNINFASVLSLVLVLIKIDKNERMCFVIDNMKSGNTQK